MTQLRQQRYARFPPGSGFLVLQRGSRRAALAGLSLYEAVTPRQRVASAAAHSMIRLGLLRLMPESIRSDLPWDWWQRWLAAVGERHVGPVGYIAFRAPLNGDRVCALLMGPDGGPVGFAKTLDARRAPFSARVRARLTEEPAPTNFRVPRTLAEGEFDGVRYILFEPLPEGRHRAPPARPDLIGAIVDEIRDRLAPMPRPAAAPSHYVVCHRGFTPRNVRVGPHGCWWVFDWDTVAWAPPLTYELRYWSAEFAYRLRPRVDRDAERVVALLRERGTDAEIAEAAEWPGNLPTHRPVEQEIRRAVAAKVRATS
jgi:hypothetical protein